MDWLIQYFASLHVGALLWAGVAVLTAALLILSRTAWGQARPLSKCIALSVYAHFLLGGYAYMTAFLEQPVAEPEVIKIAYIETQAFVEEVPHEKEDNDHTWDPIVDDRETIPEPADTNVADLRPLDEPASDMSPTVEPMPLKEPDSLAAAMEPPTMATMPQPAPVIDTEPAIEAPPRAEPLASSVPSADMAQAEPAPTPAEQPSIEEPTPMQRMAQVPAPATEAEAISDPFDQLEQTAIAADHTPQSIAPRAATIRIISPPQAAPSASMAISAPPLPRRLGDGAVMPAPYRNRAEPLKSEALRRHGGDERTEAAVDAALRWLVANQAPDGRYSAGQHGAGRESRTLGHDRGGAGSKADTAMTGLAILALVGAGHSHLEGEYQETVRRALEFLLREQKPNGDLAGDSLLYARMYCHGIAFLALSETYAMSGDHRLKPFVERALEYTVAAQHSTTGGWRYQPGDQGDLSQFGWQIMALRSAEHAGLTIPPLTRTRLETFFRSASAGEHGGLARYRKGERITRTMTAEALACRHFMGLAHNPLAIEEATNYLMLELPAAGKPNLYYWYYATVGLFPQQNEAWNRWNGALIEQLVSRQRTDGPFAGSWDTDTQWGAYGGRVYTTALSTMCLEVYYRYQPLYQAEDALREIRSAGRPSPWR